MGEKKGEKRKEIDRLETMVSDWEKPKRERCLRKMVKINNGKWQRHWENRKRQW